MKDAPCTKCEDRYVGCHADCQEYKDWRRKLDIERGKRFDAKEIDGMISSVRFGKSGNPNKKPPRRRKRE